MDNDPSTKVQPRSKKSESEIVNKTLTALNFMKQAEVVSAYELEVLRIANTRKGCRNRVLGSNGIDM